MFYSLVGRRGPPMDNREVHFYLISDAPLCYSSKLLKKTHMLRCAKSPRYNVPAKYASARRFFARLASEIFLSSLQTELFSNLL